MAADWRTQLEQLLANAANAAGAWGYGAASRGAAEPTALAALALAAVEDGTARSEARDAARRKALDWLAGLQRPDGAVPVSPDVPEPHWPTALALLAWRTAAPAGDGYPAQAQRAVRWLVETRGRQLPDAGAALDHDTMLVGWPWVAGSHSWAEPTAYAVLALRAAGHGNHPRVREAVRLLVDRALPSGGWNYGNRRVFGHELRPFPATTGLALAALAGETRDTRIARAIDYLANELPRVRAPLSLAWGLIGLGAWGAQPAEAQAWLARAAERLSAGPAPPHYTALVLIAGSAAGPVRLEAAHA